MVNTIAKKLSFLIEQVFKSLLEVIFITQEFNAKNDYKVIESVGHSDTELK